MLLRTTLRKVYHKLPLRWQLPAGAQELRRRNEQSQWWSLDVIRARQLERLQALVRHAETNVPYYGELFPRIGFHAEELRSLEDMQRLPLLDRYTVSSSFDALAARDAAAMRPAMRTTGGSTGVTVRVLMSERAQHAHLADVFRAYQWNGYTMGQRIVFFRQLFQTCPDPNAAWHYHRPRNELSINATTFSVPMLEEMLPRIARFRPEAMIACPSHLYLLSRYLTENPVPGIRPRTLLVTGEMLYDFQREQMERVFGCQPAILYGMAEHVASAAQCPAGRIHASADFTYMEILRPDGSPAAPGEVGEIVGTNLDNYAMPLLRYRTGDLAAWSDEPCPCGRALPVLEKIAGRTQDVIVTPAGVRAFPYWEFKFQEIPHVREFQIVQDAADHFLLKVLPGTGYQDEDGRQMAEMLQKGIGFPATVSVETVAGFQRTLRGKHRLVECRVPHELWTGELAREA